jgi:hypothetical protein
MRLKKELLRIRNASNLMVNQLNRGLNTDFESSYQESYRSRHVGRFEANRSSSTLGKIIKDKTLGRLNVEQLKNEILRKKLEKMR